MIFYSFFQKYAFGNNVYKISAIAETTHEQLWWISNLNFVDGILGFTTYMIKEYIDLHRNMNSNFSVSVSNGDMLPSNILGNINVLQFLKQYS